MVTPENWKTMCSGGANLAQDDVDAHRTAILLQKLRKKLPGHSKKWTVDGVWEEFMLSYRFTSQPSGWSYFLSIG